MTLKIDRVWGQVSLRGLPNPGQRSHGVPPGGAFDQEAHSCARALLDEGPENETIEVATTAFGDAPFLELSCLRSGQIALAGMEAEARVGDQLHRSPCSFKVEEGDKIQVVSGRRGMRLALAIPGFISFDGDLIDSDSGRQIHDERRLNRPMSLQPGPIRFVQADEGLAGTRWVVGNELNRVGIRLSGGPQFETSAGLSEPSTPGIIQAVKDGILIHGPDGPTIGGYRRLGCVIGVDLDRLAQLRPEQTVEFNPVSLSKARSLLHKHDETLSRIGSLIGLLDQAAERTRSRRWNQ